MTRIFMNYRRDDSGDSAGRMYDRLVVDFGKGAIFKDVYDIPSGADFPTHIRKHILDSYVLLAIIGPQWVTLTMDTGRRRLDEPNDYVRGEIEIALDNDIPIIPVLVQNARVPLADRMPPSIRKLAEKQSRNVRPDPDFHKDMDELKTAIEELRNPTTEQPGQATAPAGFTLAVALAQARGINSLGAFQQGLCVSRTFWTGVYVVQFPHGKMKFKSLDEVEQTARTFLGDTYDSHAWTPMWRPSTDNGSAANDWIQAF